MVLKFAFFIKFGPLINTTKYNSLVYSISRPMSSTLNFDQVNVDKESTTTMMRAVNFDEPGGADKLYVGNVEQPKLLIGSAQLLIKVYASAINRADILQRQGKYPSPPGESEILGLEASGVVAKIGDSCVKRWNEGDRVMALLGGGGNAEYVVVPEELVMLVPEELSFSDAAAIPETWLTAYQLLHFVGNVKSDDNVLIHAAGSGVGLAAVQLARVASANIFVTAGSDEKLAVAKAYGDSVKLVQGFNYKNKPFVDDIMKATQGHGIDLILDCIGGSYWEQNSQLLATEGHWIVYGLLGGTKVNGDLLARVLRKRCKIEGTTLRPRSLEYKARLVEQFSDKIVPLFKPPSNSSSAVSITESNIVRPVVDSQFPLGRISDAHCRMEANKNIGKIVLLVRSETETITNVHVDE